MSINIETLQVSGFEGAILGMRNPYKNRDKSDSRFVGYSRNEYGYEIGQKDLDLCQKLLRCGGDDDSKFMRMIHVQADINAPLYWWKEFDTYKVATVANSESTMHTIAKREFSLNDFSHDMLDEAESLNVSWNDQDYMDSAYDCLTDTVGMLNTLREHYLIAIDKGYKATSHLYWYEMIQLLPSSYMQKRTVDLNYQTLRRIFFARRHHKLKEWSGSNGFCEWIESLPYAEELICYDPEKPVKVKIEKKEPSLVLKLVSDIITFGEIDIFDGAETTYEVTREELDAAVDTLIGLGYSVENTRIPKATDPEQFMIVKTLKASKEGDDKMSELDKRVTKQLERWAKKGATVREIVRLHNEGVSNSDIAKKLGCSEGWVRFVTK